MHRPTIAVLAVVLLCGGIYLSFAKPEGTLVTGLHAACWRVGGLLAAIWIAHPQLAKLPSWVYLLFFAATLAIAVRPRLAIIVLPLVIVAFWLRPRGGPGSTPTSSGRQ